MLLAARHTLFFAPGEEKVAPLRAIEGPDYDPQRWPAQLIARNGADVNWFLDRAAAAALHP
jgi:6-phosphogluconolactonase/glucosamine-6-phosphate isomerase/deaminase